MAAVVPRKLAASADPPTVALVYEQGGRRFLHRVGVKTEGTVRPRARPPAHARLHTTPFAVQNPTRVATSLKKAYPHLYGTLALHQLTRVIAQLFMNAPDAGTTSGASGEDFKAASAAFGDLQTAGQAQLTKAKLVMNQGFEANRLKPGDEGYQYDKRMSFEAAEDASGWDDEDSDGSAPAAPAPASPAPASPAPAPAPVGEPSGTGSEAAVPPATGGYRPSWAAAEGDAASDGSALSLGDVESLPDETGAGEGDGEYSEDLEDSSDLDVDAIY